LDALIASIDDGRMDGITLGTVMAKLLPTERITLTRWIKAMKEVARISPMHLQFAFDAIHEAMKGVPLAEDGFSPPVPLLEFFYELVLASGEAVTDDRLIQCLQKMKGKGKGSKLARLLLDAKKPPPASKHRMDVAMQILHIRVERAERWRDWLMRTAVSEEQAISNSV
jgi:hypothetical protein